MRALSIPLIIAIAIIVVPHVSQAASKVESPSVGNKKAPVTLTVWCDYQAEFCSRYYADTLSRVYTTYVQKGKVRLVHKNFQFLGEASDEAGVYSHAIWKVAPKKWYDWHTDVQIKMGSQEDLNGDTKTALLRTAAKEAGINMKKLDKHLSKYEEKYRSALKAELSVGQDLGVNGAPHTFVEWKSHPGAVPFQTIQDSIESEL